MKLCAVFSLMALGGTALSAGLIGPQFPPPGGVTFIGSGNSGTAGGRTFSYSNFDSSQYGQLYWGPKAVSNVNNVGESPASNMQFIGLVGGAYEFDSTTDWNYNSLQTGLVQLPTRLLLTLSAPFPEDTEANLGATTNPSYPLFLVTGNYSANFVFEASYLTTWTPVVDFQNSHNNFGNQVNTSAGFAFFNTAAVPEPGTWALFGIGLALLGTLRRRG